eukprot:jgi/Chrpa1/4780/Chrysochromulina_OHIO_Genome00015627-RA
MVSQRFVVCCAVEEESKHAERLLEGSVVERPLNLGDRAWRRVCGAVGAASVEIVTMGTGMVNAASAMTALAAETICSSGMPVDGVLGFGGAGGHIEQLETGDLVVASSCVPLGAHRLLPDGSKRYNGFETTIADPVRRSIPTDERLRSALERAASATGRRAVVGHVGSSDTVSQQPAAIQEMHAALGTLCEDQHSAALAQVCTSLPVPFACVRDISTNELRCTSARVAAGNSTSVDVQKLGWRSAATVMGAIRELCPVPLIRPVCFVTDAPALSAFLDARESARLPLYASAVSSADSAVLVFVPSVDASPVGMVVVHVRAREEMGWSDECGTLEYLQAPNGYLESLRVKDEHRRKGFGRLLLEAAEAWAFAHQRSELWVHVARSNECACRFYLACGWLERYIVCPSWNQGKPMVVFSKRAGAGLSAAVAGGSVGSLSQSALAKRARDVEDVEDEAGGENEADDG